MYLMHLMYLIYLIYLSVLSILSVLSCLVFSYLILSFLSIYLFIYLSIYLSFLCLSTKLVDDVRTAPRRVTYFWPISISTSQHQTKQHEPFMWIPAFDTASRAKTQNLKHNFSRFKWSCNAISVFSPVIQVASNQAWSLWKLPSEEDPKLPSRTEGLELTNPPAPAKQGGARHGRRVCATSNLLASPAFRRFRRCQLKHMSGTCLAIIL